MEQDGKAGRQPAGGLHLGVERHFAAGKLASGQAMSLYAISILVVILCLAALYESWSVPFSVIMVILLGLLWRRWQRCCAAYNDVYFSRWRC